MDLRKAAASLSLAGTVGFLVLWIPIRLLWSRDLALGLLSVGVAAGGVWLVLFYRGFWNSPPIWKHSDLAGLLAFGVSSAIMLLVAMAASVFRNLNGLG